MAKKKAEEKLNLDNILFKCRDILRQAPNSGSFFEKALFKKRVYFVEVRKTG